MYFVYGYRYIYILRRSQSIPQVSHIGQNWRKICSGQSRGNFFCSFIQHSWNPPAHINPHYQDHLKELMNNFSILCTKHFLAEDECESLFDDASRNQILRLVIWLIFRITLKEKLQSTNFPNILPWWFVLEIKHPHRGEIFNSHIIGGQRSDRNIDILSSQVIKQQKMISQTTITICQISTVLHSASWFKTGVSWIMVKSST